MVQKSVDPDAHVILGCVIDESLKDRICVTVIATGFNNGASKPIVKEVKQLHLAHSFDSAGMDDDIDKPTFLRKVATVAYTNDAIGIENDAWDMPTFLRKKVN